MKLLGQALGKVGPPSPSDGEMIEVRAWQLHPGGCEVKMRVRVNFYSYFKDLAGCGTVEEDLPAGSTLGALLSRMHERFPRLAPMAKSTLVAVGVEYQDRHYLLKEGDEVSLFPPVQGG